MPGFFRFWALAGARPSAAGWRFHLGCGMGREEELATAAAAAGVAKSAPPVVVSGMTLAGYSLNDWVLVATLIWIAVQLVWFVWSNIIRPRFGGG